MDKQQAKEILMLYRPGTAGEVEPEMAEALALAKREPELAGWLEQHCAVQEAIRARFRETVVPEGLMEQIISERKAAMRRGVQRRAVLLATAALIIGLIGVARWYWRPRAPAEDRTFAAFRVWTVSKVLREYPKMDLETNDLAQIQEAVQKHGQGNFTLPRALAATTPTGCATNLHWNNRDHRVSMICFNSGKTSTSAQPDLFLFITDRAAVADAPPTNSPVYARFMRLTTASWSDGDKTYVLGGMGNEAFIKEFL